jgi:riboflavin kinase/FMN adenylyltransferase
MQHTYGLDDVHIQGAWLTIGSYDGVHLGHQQIISDITSSAHSVGAPAVVLTFFPHPMEVLRGRRDAFYLTLPEEKAAILGEMGVDLVVTHPFTKEVAASEPEEFIRYLQDHLGFTRLWVGYDFALGRDRKGDVSRLRVLGSEFGFQVEVVDAYLQAGEPVSSSRVRLALEENDIDLANRLLGRRYRLSGAVVPGDGRGKSIGVPTANLQIDQKKAVPGPGVYACYAISQGERYPAVTNIGVRPTFEDGPVAARVETHILDFDHDLYGQEVGLEFAAFLRPERKFDGIESLVAQIQTDIETGRQILGG